MSRARTPAVAPRRGPLQGALLTGLLCGSSLLAAGTANAALPPTTEVNVALFSSDPLNTLSHPTTAVLSASLPDYGGRSAASAGYGSLGTAVSVNYNDFIATAAFQGSAEAFFRDHLTITAPGSGTVVFSMKLDGTASSNAPGVVLPRLQFGFVAFNDQGGARIDIASIRDGYPNGVFQAPALNFVSGEAVTLSGLMLVDLLQVAPSFGGPLFADILYGNTATLSGIEVFDAFGAPVSDFTIASASGTAYGRYGVLAPPAAVPEPGMWLMLIGGFAALGSALRRRRATTRGADPAVG